MLLKFIESRYLVDASIDDCSSLVQKALNDIGLRNLVVKKEAPPNYLLVAYSPGWVGKALEIEFVFKRRQNGTEVFVKWPYTKEVPTESEDIAEFRRQEQERRQKTERLIEEFKRKIGAADVPATQPSQENSA